MCASRDDIRKDLRTRDDRLVRPAGRDRAGHFERITEPTRLRELRQESPRSASRVGPMPRSALSDAPVEHGGVDSSEADCYAACAERCRRFVAFCREYGLSEPETLARLERIAGELLKLSDSSPR